VESKYLGDSWYELNSTFSASRALGTGSFVTPPQPTRRLMATVQVTKKYKRLIWLSMVFIFKRCCTLAQAEWHVKKVRIKEKRLVKRRFGSHDQQTVKSKAIQA
jgi:Ni,Fe-hydrogenase I cytochrome b subunit